MYCMRMLNLKTKLLTLIFLFVGIFVPVLSHAQMPETKEVRSLFIDQLIMVGLRGMSYETTNDFGYILSNTNVGGIILFDYDTPTKTYKRNIQSKSQMKILTDGLQEHAKTPLFIAIDEEGGSVNRLKKSYGFTPIPSARILGTKSISYIKGESVRLARDLKSVGININFAPSVDVDVNKNSPAIGKYGRSFSYYQTKVLSSARAFIEGHHEEGIITSLKHFPGHGSATTDSHKGFTDITKTYKERELYPFQELITEGNADSVMVGHLYNKSIDSVYPASLSSKFITGILRNKLGFNGLVVTDDLDMRALSDQYTFEKKTVQTLKAGADMLIYSNNITSYDRDVVIRARNVIDAALVSGELSWEEIIDSYNRIQNLKKEYGIVK